MWRREAQVTACLLFTASSLINASPDIFWGVGSAAYQYEGASTADGRGASIWDTFAHTPGKIENGDTGDVADNFYYLYPEDIALMQSSGIRNFRFSISWPRIYPYGAGQVNQAGLDFYTNLTDALLAANIEPFVTLYHWDYPQALEDAYGGLLSADQFAADFANYAQTVVTALGERVTYYTTINEPDTICSQGYNQGNFAPGRCTNRTLCAEGDSSTEPYICTHSLLVAHAAAVTKMRAAAPHARISINWSVTWALPSTETDADAAQRALDFGLGQYADPIFLGDYPDSVKQRTSIPPLTDAEKAALKGSVDWFALNHYTSYYVKDDPTGSSGPHGYTTSYYSASGEPLGAQAESVWLYVYPPGLSQVLYYVNERYGAPDIIITENGVDVPNENAVPSSTNDQFRISYIEGYLEQALAAKNAGVHLLGYFYWSLLDNFEWANGYSCTFGLVHVDFSSANLTRTPKVSLQWISRYFS